MVAHIPHSAGPRLQHHRGIVTGDLATSGLDGVGRDVTGDPPAGRTKRIRAETPSPILLIPVANIPSYVGRVWKTA